MPRAAADEKLSAAGSHRRSVWVRLLAALVIAVLGGMLGKAYGDAFYGPDDFDYQLGFRIGFSIAFVSALIEIFYIRNYRRSWIRRVAYLPGLVVRVLVLTLLIRLCIVANQALSFWLGDASAWQDFTFANQLRDTLLSVVVVIAFIMISQFTSIIGMRRFLHLVSGRYYRPAVEERIFMFVDLVGSSALARRLGDLRFHDFLAEVFFQLDRSSIGYSGEVVSYVGDAVIYTWPLRDDPQRNRSCLKALRAMHRQMDMVADAFEVEFGERPHLRAAIHAGPVVVGECGDSRRQITFLGDAVNMTARIETLTKTLDVDYLISQQALERIELPANVEAIDAGQHELRGSQEPFTMHRLLLK
ncbi:adenylate/guanylate cyclase domain-containing protein [Ahrensia sp. R2A130]|uniref:adenylate/guanylate cyclase domain-containing protein n=1 Tax=Ahrensia sp. R2A130 TaxID=744979 RepID=UPI0001E0A429|nr:adenylate/guanylate cyclase domain-containing protein [Ahrensia sp. R2A130]EFL90077.1 adenylate/guanylate cyclase [Ahrensia sp. R2A130]